MMQSVFMSRRQQLLSELPANSIALVPAATEVKRNADTDYLFRQDSSFYYLTGFKEPEALAIFVPNRAAGSYILLTRARNPEMEIWTGYRAGPDGAMNDYAADEAFLIDDAIEILSELIVGKTALYYPIGATCWLDDFVADYISERRYQGRKGEIYPQQICNIDPLIHAMRVIKSPEEISLLRNAASLSAKAHVAAMQATKPGCFEYQLEGTLRYHFMQAGAKEVAYTPIVAAGANACVLHYVDNDAQVQAGDLVLIDAGGEYDYYAADITRTFPANGQFSEPQRALYEVVLAAQLAGIDAVRPGIAWNDIEATIVRAITAGLVRLGLLSGDVDGLIKSRAYTEFYMHRFGHMLGLDVHDPCQYKQGDAWVQLRPGMV